MKQNLKRLLSMLLVVTLCVPVLPVDTEAATLKANTAQSETVQTEALQSETANTAVPKNAGFGYRDVEDFDTSFAGEPTAQIPSATALPVSYSSASNIPSSISVAQKADYVTAVKDQNPYGTCWAHAAISVAESSYIKANGMKASTSGIDWNEYHLVYYFWNTPEDPLGLFGGDFVVNNSGNNDLDAGGNSIFTLHTYANWIGASADKSFNANDVLSGKGAGNTEFAFNAAAHMENGYLLTMPNMNTSNYQADMNVVKQMIMEYGSVAMSYYAAHWNPYFVNNAYQYVNVNPGTNHAVTIVGWNDNIPATAFGITAPGNGAWLVKNSWGTSWGQGGYFWLSYYDQSIGANAFAFDFTDADTYDNNYQYDGGVYAMGGFYNDSTITGANAFVADSPETIEAVGFYTANVNTNYTIQIYTDLAEDALPSEGTLALTKTGTQAYAGFHTVDLGTSIVVDEGERYAVVVTIEKPGYEVYMMTDASGDYSWIQTYSYAKEGESYLGSDVYSLEDVNEGNTYYQDGYSIRIKSFTNEGGLRQGDDGNWYYYIGGEIDYTYFGLAEYGGYEWYVKDGMVNFKITGAAQCGEEDEWYFFKGGAVQKVSGLYSDSQGYWYVQNGRIQLDFTGLASNSLGWWYVKNGKIDFTHFGVVTYAGKQWYVKGGQVNFDINGLVQCGTSTEWYYFKGGIVQNVTGLYNNAYGWWYVKNGKLDFTFTGLASNSMGWWYVKNGQVDMKYFGVVKSGNTTWYVKNGQVNFNINGLAQCGSSTEWYYFKNGAVQNVTGLYSNSLGWWYVQNGKIVFDYTGLASNSQGWWYVKNGQIDLTYNGVATNASGTWYVEKGKVDFTKSGILSRGSKWYYFKNGAVQRVDTVASNSMGWWAIFNGEVDFTFDGIAGNTAGLWYCVDGKVDFNYTGTVEYDGQTYNVVKGKATLVQ